MRQPKRTAFRRPRSEYRAKGTLPLVALLVVVAVPGCEEPGPRTVVPPESSASVTNGTFLFSFKAGSTPDVFPVEFSTTHRGVVRIGLNVTSSVAGPANVSAMIHSPEGIPVSVSTNGLALFLPGGYGRWYHAVDSEVADPGKWVGDVSILQGVSVEIQFLWCFLDASDGCTNFPQLH
jgi:hypothetical protein